MERARCKYNIEIDNCNVINSKYRLCDFLVLDCICVGCKQNIGVGFLKYFEKCECRTYDHPTSVNGMCFTISGVFSLQLIRSFLVELKYLLVRL